MKTSELNIPVTEERFGWQILGERISNHVARCTIHKNNFPSSDTIAECMNTKINVLGAFPVNGVLRHEAARTIVLVQGSWRELREGKVRKETVFPHEFISCFAGSNKLSFTARGGNCALFLAFPGNHSSIKHDDEGTDRPASLWAGGPVSICVCNKAVGVSKITCVREA